jgi:hypothetical protein
MEVLMHRRYLGQCHCGRVAYAVEADLEGGPNAICNCTNCNMKGFLHHHVEKTRFKLLTAFDDIKLYRFGTLSAEHYFCKSCGVESFYRSRSDPDKWDINLRCLRHADTGERVDIYALSYELHDGEHWEESQNIRHKREQRAKETGIPHQPKSWRLLAPAESVAPDLDVAAAFKRTWESD